MAIPFLTQPASCCLPPAVYSEIEPGADIHAVLVSEIRGSHMESLIGLDVLPMANVGH